MKRFLFLTTCLLAVATCSFGATTTNFTALSPPDVSHVISASVPVFAMAAVAMPEDLVVKLQSFFERHSLADIVYENGGVLFFDRGAADSYGKSQTAEYTRAQIISNKTNGSEAPDISEIDLLTLNQPELAKLAKSLKLETADNKKETLLAALTEYQKTLKTE